MNAAAATTVRKDRAGHDYNDLLGIQCAHCLQWESRLTPELYHEICTYVAAQNEPAADETQKHRVFRGQDLAQIIYDWPELKDCYPKPGSECI